MMEGQFSLNSPIPPASLPSSPLPQCDLSLPASSSLPPLLPMAAQLSQYATSTTAGYNQPASSPSPGSDYSRRPLSVLF